MNLLLAGFAASSLATSDSIVHPLDPLTATEIAVVREVLSAAGKLSPGLRFATLALREPPKQAVLDQVASGRFQRAAEALLYEWATSTPIRAQVDLVGRRLVAWDTLPSRQPPTRNLIRRRLEEIARKDPRWVDALRRRGLHDPTAVTLIPNLAESAPLPWRNGEAVVGATGYDQERLTFSALLREIELEVNLTRGTIVTFTDRSSRPDSLAGSPAGPATGPRQPLPAAPRPGPGPVIQGSAIRWRNWELHYGVHPRRGLELWDIAWKQGGRARRVLYRASVAEAMAAYGDPDFTVWYPRDAGNAGLGDYQRNSAIPEGDAPAGTSFADAVFADAFGRATVMPRAVAIYERDGGVLWRHASTARWARELVISSHATIDDYDFVFNWIFGEDGGIEVEVGLTGIMLLHREPAEPQRANSHGSFGHRVAPGLVAPNHQHFFSYRLDFDIDAATPNRVLELETAGGPQSRANPLGLWFAMKERALGSEANARRNLHTAASRKWRVINPETRNALGDPSGYTLLPGEVAIPYASPRSPARITAGFVGAQLWVTPYRREEMHAAGDFVNFNLPGQGLPGWTRENRNLLDTDVVLWYTLGVTHIPRPEDYPVMPVHRASFRLIPSGFFGRNPTLEP